MSTRLTDRTALITGASRGIGEQIAIALATLGCNLVLHSRDRRHTETLEAKLAGYDVKVISVEADLSLPDEVSRLITELQAIDTDIDILYNNAAIMPPHHDNVWNIPDEIFRQSFETNFVSQIRISNALIPGMIERGWGRVINLISDINQLPQLSPYAITKSALEKYTHDIEPALRDSGVFMNSLNPGWLRTDMGSDEAPNPVESVIPGALLPVLLDAPANGRRFNAHDFKGETIDAALTKATV